MIQQYMEIFLAKEADVKGALRKLLGEGDYNVDYKDLGRVVIEAISVEELSYDHLTPQLDPERLHIVDFGDYQGTLLLVTAPVGYQPSTFYTMVVDYGSCSGCDTLQAVLMGGGEKRADLLFDLARNMLASMHKVGGTLY